MNPITVFIVLATLIGGSALVIDDANGAELPDEVIRIHSEIQVYTPEPHLFKEYLRHPGHESFLPKAISYRLDCYSDGSGTVSTLQGFEAIHRALTSDGRDLLRVVVQDIAYYSCSTIWEKRYESDTLGEGTDTWYF